MSWIETYSRNRKMTWCCSDGVVVDHIPSSFLSSFLCGGFDTSFPISLLITIALKKIPSLIACGLHFFILVYMWTSFWKIGVCTKTFLINWELVNFRNGLLLHHRKENLPMKADWSSRDLFIFIFHIILPCVL